MAWTDYSSTASGSWAWGSQPGSTSIMLDSTVLASDVMVGVSVAGTINIIEDSYNIPGFEDGYQPAGVPETIANNIGTGGGGGSARPGSGFLYPRG